ncbi:hypothetical protein LTS09_013894 [Friedmanniomyces endolithicus]|nr:hypothetical protein LTS09_013894 [Friedmanniomyces endolithicus]
MRLLHTSSYTLKEFFDEPPPGQYAILSHRWRDEIKYDDLRMTPLTSHAASASKDKLMGACEQARQDHLQWLWADTVCIDKSSSQELSTALNSMFKYYQNATCCYTYLDDVVKSGGIGRSTLHAGQASEWFSRGWTLQELLASRHMKVYDREWKLIGTKAELASQLSQITKIGIDYLTGKAQLEQASIACKLSWMAGRRTGKVEDIAYSLIGIFRVFMTPQYGEGTNAFVRLQEAILKSPSGFDETLFAWTAPQDGELQCYGGQPWTPPNDRWGLLAPSPDCFKDSGDLIRNFKPRPGGGFQLTHQGVVFELPYMDTRSKWGYDFKDISLALKCSRGGLQIVLELWRASKDDVAWERMQCSSLGKPAKEKKGSLLVNDKANQIMARQITVSQPRQP